MSLLLLALELGNLLSRRFLEAPFELGIVWVRWQQLEALFFRLQGQIIFPDSKISIAQAVLSVRRSRICLCIQPEQCDCFFVVPRLQQPICQEIDGRFGKHDSLRIPFARIVKHLCGPLRSARLIDKRPELSRGSLARRYLSVQVHWRRHQSVDKKINDLSDELGMRPENLGPMPALFESRKLGSRISR